MSSGRSYIHVIGPIRSVLFCSLSDKSSRPVVGETIISRDRSYQISMSLDISDLQVHRTGQIFISSDISYQIPKSLDSSCLQQFIGQVISSCQRRNQISMSSNRSDLQFIGHIRSPVYQHRSDFHVIGQIKSTFRQTDPISVS